MTALSMSLSPTAEGLGGALRTGEPEAVVLVGDGIRGCFAGPEGNNAEG